MKEILFSNYNASEDLRPAGLWSFESAGAEAILDLRGDSTLFLAEKVQGRPINIVTGAWGLSSEDGNLVLLGERAGYGGMPVSYEFEWIFGDDGELILDEEDSDSFLPAVEEPEFVPGPLRFNPALAQVEIENAGGFLEEAPVSDGYEESGSYTDSFGTEYSYDYELPYLQINTENALGINQAILDRFHEDIEQALASIENEGGTDLMNIGWEAGVYGGLVCIRVFETYNYGFTDYEIYYYDAFEDEILKQDQVLEQLGISKDRFMSATRSAVQLYMEEENASLSAQEKEDYGYYQAFDWTLSDKNMCYENIRVFIDEDGDIGVIMPVGSMAGADWYYRAIYPDF